MAQHTHWSYRGIYVYITRQSLPEVSLTFLKKGRAQLMVNRRLTMLGKGEELIYIILCCRAVCLNSVQAGSKSQQVSTSLCLKQPSAFQKKRKGRETSSQRTDGRTISGFNLG